MIDDLSWGFAAVLEQGFRNAAPVSTARKKALGSHFSGQTS